MPLYLCNTAKGAISDAAKPKIAADITRIHCDVTGAPAKFVHAFFVEEAAAPPIDGNTAVLFGSIRAGRTDAQKARIISEMRQSIHTHAGIELDEIAMLTTDVPAAWAFEGGDIMPEPGEEAAWLARHEAAPAAE
ncbi:MAG: tautomerase family protein [Henriciella sp.]|nr:tautomerase family protein [Henriciella sp.]